MSQSTHSHRLGWIITGAVAAAALLVVGLTVLVITLVSRDTRQDISLADLQRSDSGITALEGFKDDTAVLCADKQGCVQGYEADHADYFKFASKDNAREFASSTPDAYQSNWIVIHFTDPNLSNADKATVQEYIDSLATSE